MASSLSVGDIVKFKNPNDGLIDIGKVMGLEGGDLKVQTRDGIVYVYPSDVIFGGRRNRRSRRNRKSRRNRRSRRN
jgi:hypothetical protein